MALRMLGLFMHDVIVTSKFQRSGTVSSHSLQALPAFKISHILSHLSTHARALLRSLFMVRMGRECVTQLKDPLADANIPIPSLASDIVERAQCL